MSTTRRPRGGQRVFSYSIRSQRQLAHRSRVFLPLSVCVCHCRYFACPSKYGLFAPVHKVAREGGHTTTTVHTTTRTTKVTSPPRLLSRTGSRESVASVASNISSTSTSSKNSRQLARQSLKPRLGVTALAAGQPQPAQKGTGNANQVG